VNSQFDGRLVSKVSGCGKDVSSALGRTNRCQGARTSLTYTHHNVHGVRLHVYIYTLYSGKLLRGQTLVNFEVLWLFMKVLSTKFGVWRPLTAPASNLEKFSL